MERKRKHRIESYRDLEAWQIAMEIVVETYRASRRFPPEEKFGLTSQVRRAAVSIPSNIAEGHNRLGPGEYRRFVSIVRGSVAEVETQLAIGVALGFTEDDEITELTSQLTQLGKMLFVLYRRLTP